MVLSMIFIVIAVIIQLPWEIWQWRVVGSAFLGWTGKPTEELLRTNTYVYYMTVVRSPWGYVKILPQMIWTLIPSLVLLAMQWHKHFLRKRGIVLVCWIALVVGVHIVLGMLGYPKILRFVILVTPATVVLFALVVGGALQTIREHKCLSGGKSVTLAFLLLAVVGLGLEITQDLKTSLVDNRKWDSIIPLLGQW